MGTSHQVELELVDAKGARKLTACIEEREWIGLKLYVVDAAKLCQCALVKQEFSYNISVRLENGNQVVTGGDLPPDDDFELMVFRLRKFLLNDEPVSFSRIRGALGRRVSDESFRSGLRMIKDQFYRMPFAVTVSTQGKSTPLTSYESLMAWLNSELLHHEEDKAQLFRRISSLIPEKASRSVFGMSLNEKARAVINLANVVRVFLGQQEDFDFGSLVVRRG